MLVSIGWRNGVCRATALVLAPREALGIGTLYVARQLTRDKVEHVLGEVSFYHLQRYTCILLLTSLTYPSLDCLPTTDTDTHYKKQSIECCHHVEWRAGSCTIEQGTASLR
jgi:hypothetical protein